MTLPREYNKHRDTFFFKIMPEDLRNGEKRKTIHNLNTLSRLWIALGKTRTKLVETYHKKIIFCGKNNSANFDKCLQSWNKNPQLYMPSKVFPKLLDVSLFLHVEALQTTGPFLSAMSPLPECHTNAIM